MTLLWSSMGVLLAAVVQVALVFYCGQLAMTAAEDGVRSGRTYGSASIEANARRDAQKFLSRAAGPMISDIVVSVSVDPVGLLHVRVDGTPLSLVPGVSMRVSREAVGGLERVAA